MSLAPPPADPAALADFPRMVLQPITRLFRVGRADREPWWFGSSLEGRFDLPEPDGTCYLAMDPLSAVLEVIGSDREGGFVSAELFAGRRVYELHVEEDHSLADLAAAPAAGFGVTLEIHSLVPYDLPQAWARRLRAAGFQGVCYLLRHHPSGVDGIALFGLHGERDDWPIESEDPIGAAVQERLERSYGIRVLPVPHSSEIELEPR